MAYWGVISVEIDVGVGWEAKLIVLVFLNPKFVLGLIVRQEAKLIALVFQEDVESASARAKRAIPVATETLKDSF